jgi:putative ABC transport system permease protein
MRKVALRGLLEHKGRLLATFFAVVMGVAFMSGVLTLTDTMNKAFDDLFADVYRDTDAVVRSSRELGDEATGGVRAQVDESLVDEVAAVDGVAAAEGNVEGYAQVIDREGDVVGDPAMGAPTFGANWQVTPELNPFDIVDGRGPEAAGEIVIDRGTADDSGYAVGDTVPVQTQQGSGEYELVGIARFGTADSPGGSNWVMWTTAEAQELVGQEGRYNAIGVVADDGVSQDEVVAAVDEVVPDGTEVLTGEAITEETQSDVRQSLSFLTTFFLIFALIAIFVGTFVIYNSFSIIVAQRTREMALLRAIGASRKQVRRSVIVEAVVVGLVASVVGFLAGLGVAILLGELLQIPEGSLAILPTSIITAIAVGVIVTVVSALLPAWRASRVPPLAAMREVAVDTTGRSRVRIILGALITLLGFGLVIGGALDGSPQLVGYGVALVFLGVLFLGPAMARPVSSLVGAPLARVRGIPGRLARSNAGRNPRRTSATAQALMIGVGIVAFTLIINSSIRASIDESLERGFAGDFVVDSGTFGMIGLPTTVADDLRDVEGIDIVAPARFGQATVNGEEEGVGATDPGALELLDLDVVQGNGDMAPGTVLITDDRAESDGLSVGDPVEIQFVDQEQPVTYTVGGIYEPSETGSIGDFALNLDDFTAAVPNATDSLIFLSLDDGVSVEEAEPRLERVVEPYATAEVQSVEEYKDTIGGQLDILLQLISGLLTLAIIIALLGIANTVALSIIERTREIGLLRAVGMSRRQLRSAIRLESVIISVFGTLVGLAIGLVGGWGIVTSLEDEGFGVFRIPVNWLVFLVVMAAILGTLAALVPAWRASHRNVLDSIATE